MYGIQHYADVVPTFGQGWHMRIFSGGMFKDCILHVCMCVRMYVRMCLHGVCVRARACVCMYVCVRTVRDKCN